MNIKQLVRKAYEEKELTQLDVLTNMTKDMPAVSDEEQNQFADWYFELQEELRQIGDRTVKSYSKTQNVVTVTYKGMFVTSWLEDKAV